MAVLLIATLDTKGHEAGFARDCLRRHGLDVIVLDAGTAAEPSIVPEIPREEVLNAGQFPSDSLRKSIGRGQAVEMMTRAVTAWAVHRHATAPLQGVLGLGGSAGTAIATAAMRALPFGLPKVMVSTMAAGQVRPYVGVRDILMMPAVVDLAGLNRISRVVLSQAAAALAGMVRAELPLVGDTLPLVTATMFGVTTPCVTHARQILERIPLEVLTFHATGTGGETMEAFIADGLVSGVLDLTTTELADELVGGVLSAGPNRLTAAAMRGIPQVISVGALDMVNFGPVETIPERFRDRKFHIHNSAVTLMRTTPRECDQLGKEIAHKASAAKGPTAILLPLGGVSALDVPGGAFWWPEADQALFQSIRNWLSPDVELIESPAHINDPQFAQLAADTLWRLMRKPQ